MSRTWTEAQSAAMDIRDKTLLVSAAAGSGKTATLTERIIRRLTDSSSPADISKMLIVTFTRSAAAELRTRIFSALSDALAVNPKDKHLASQLMKLSSAKICTIDSFYLDILRSNFSALGIPSSFRIADETEYTIIAKRIMEAKIDLFYENEDTFPLFCECFSGVRGSNRLYEIFSDLHSHLSSIPEGIEFLKMCAARTKSEAELDFLSTSFGITLRKTAKEMFEHYLTCFSEALEFISSDEDVYKAYGRSFAYELNFCKELLSAANNTTWGYRQIKDILEGYSPIRLGSLKAEYSSDLSLAYKEMRTEFSKKIKALREKSFSKSEETIRRAMHDTALHTDILYRLLAEFEHDIDDEKRRLGILTFDDVRRYTLNLLVNSDGSPTELAKQYATQFTDIYIDEYQDVDRVQDLIFSSISNETNRFMVGDIKQSIYSFRGAEPMLFASYRSRFPSYKATEAENSSSATVFMSNNFRCDENVIRFTNLVCSCIFSACADSIGYCKDDDLVFSKQKPREDYTSPKVTVSVITPPTNTDGDHNSFDDGKDKKEWEAEYIALEIERLIRTEKKADGKPILAGDIAVLFRAKGMSPYISTALKRRGIQCSESDAERYFEDPDVLMMLCLLNTIDNPERDIYLAGTLRSPVFSFDMNELIEIQSSASSNTSLFGALCEYATSTDNDLAIRCTDAINTLDVWRENAAAMPVDRFMRMLFDCDKFIASGLISQPDSKGEGGNLLLLYEYARSFESGSFKGLYQFIEYINSVIEDGKKLPGGEKGSSDDRVKLMTIHKSKGLEFPVCFVCNTGATLKQKESRDSLIFDYPSGVALKIADGSGFGRINTPMRESLLATKAIKSAEEEMRILYVALTRARERLYVTASSSKDGDKLLALANKNAVVCDRYTIINQCSSYLDWILLALTRSPADSVYSLNFIEAQSFEEEQKEAPLAIDACKDTIDTELIKKLHEEFEFKYEYLPLSKIPSKVSVSRIYPDFLDENNDSLELFSEGSRAAVPDFFLSTKKEIATGAQRGTATHLFLQFCDFAYAHKYGAKEELARLCEKRFLPQNAASLIYTDELESFLKSALFAEIRSADKIIREQRFNVRLSPKNFTSDEALISRLEDEHLAVQGVIDLILIDKDGNISLYDYKTDRLCREELADPSLAEKKMNERHALQLSYYAKAVELLFGKPCKKVCVYSTHAARLFDIALTSFEKVDLI